MLRFFVQHPKAATKWCLCFCATCLQGDEISYYNAKDNVSVLFFFSPSAYLLSFHFSPGKHTGHTQTWASNMVLLHSTLSLLSFLSPPHLPYSPPFSFSYSPHSYLIFPLFIFFFSPTLYYCLSLFTAMPPSFASSPSFFFPCSFLSVIPPPTLSQVKRFLPCFSSNWQMRCMSWLHCCFIRKQLFTLSLSLPTPHPLAFLSLSLPPPHHPAPSLPCILSSISHHAFLHISPCLHRSHWCKLLNAR